MRIYISGKITDLPLQEVKEKLQDAKEFLEVLGFDVVNPLSNGLNESHSWNEHMVKNIEILMKCDAIYMLDNWADSKEANIEYYIAKMLGKDIWYESKTTNIHTTITHIKTIIHEVTGITFEESIKRSKKTNMFFARMLFVYHCRKHGMTLSEIGGYIFRDHSTILYCLKKYQDEIKHNSHFRSLAVQVNNKMNYNNEKA